MHQLSQTTIKNDANAQGENFTSIALKNDNSDPKFVFVAPDKPV